MNDSFTQLQPILQPPFHAADCCRPAGSALTMGMPGMVAASVDANRGLGGGAAEKSCIFILLCGGPSHLDTWDLKPDAPGRDPRPLPADRHHGPRHAHQRAAHAAGRR